MKVFSAASELINGHKDWGQEIGITLNSKDDYKWLIWTLPAVKRMWKLCLGYSFKIISQSYSGFPCSLGLSLDHSVKPANSVNTEWANL